jgi:predicted dehydrogenase
MKVRWGLVGCGDVACRKVAPSFQQVPGAELIAVTSRQHEHAETLAKRFGIPRVYSSYRDLLQDDDIEAVYVATPPYLHHTMTLDAAAAGKHVLCEKPMAVSLEQCSEMIAVCKARNVRLMVAYYRHFWPQFRALKRVIDEGHLGELLTARTAVAGDIEKESQSALRWKLAPALSGGGFLMDVGCHRIELLLYFLGDVTSVDALVDNGSHQVDMRSSLQIRFRNSAFATGAFSWVSQTPIDEFEVGGSRCRAWTHAPGANRILVQEGATTRNIEVEPDTSTHAGLIEHMVEAIRTGRTPEVDGEAGMRVHQVIAAAYRSAREKRTVFVNEEKY